MTRTAHREAAEPSNVIPFRRRPAPAAPPSPADREREQNALIRQLCREVRELMDMPGSPLRGGRA